MPASHICKAAPPLRLCRIIFLDVMTFTFCGGDKNYLQGD